MLGRRSNNDERFFVFPTGEEKTAQCATATIGAAAAGAAVRQAEPQGNIPEIVH
jgi:endonuclease V-like protein UPF0215 family